MTPITLRRLPAVCVAILIGIACLASPVSAEDVDAVLEQFDAVQASLNTLSADFTETTISLLLKEPIVSDGQFYMTKPDSIRWEYTRPEAMSFVIAQGEYTGYFPDQRRAERRSIRRWKDQLFRFFGLGQASAELAKFYDISLSDIATEDEGTYLLALTPKKRRARKRVEEVWFWLDGKTYLPRKVEYRGRDGASRVIEFRDVRINPDLAAGLYTVEIPPGVPVTDGFSGLPNLQTDSAQ